ncbi:MAG: hypothetical protein JSV45_10760 [Chromatiales bacterium]|nr:MAG: hypothetical protein JSV45_10760 [Chromatiales bacterium]
MIAATIRKLGGFLYRLAFLSAGLYLLYRATLEPDAARTATGLGLSLLCMLQFLVLIFFDYRQAQRRTAKSMPGR